MKKTVSLVTALVTLFVIIALLRFNEITTSAMVSIPPTPFPSPTPAFEAQAYTPWAVIDYPWGYGQITGRLVSIPSFQSASGLCVGMAKVFCNDYSDPFSPGSGCVSVFDESWSPRAWTDDEGYFIIDTHVGYATRDNGRKPIDGGTGYFVLIAMEYCSMAYGRYDVINPIDNFYIPLVVKIESNKVLDIGEIYTWLRSEGTTNEQN